MANLFRECESLTQSLAKRHGIELVYDCVEPPLQVRADYTRLKQIVLNLVSNAVKYNRPKGRAGVSCKLLDSRQVRITVMDTGVGIKSEDLGELFKPFSRLGVEGSNIEGTGIGLLITKQLVELINGTLGLESTPGQGSTFWIDLPGQAVGKGASDVREPGSKD